MTKKEACAFHYIDNQQADELKEEYEDREDVEFDDSKK